MITPEDSQTMFLDDQIGDLSDYEYIESRLDSLKNLKLNSFDIESFIEYVNEMPDDYFEKLWQKYIKPALLKIEEKWIYLDSEKFDFLPTAEIKKTLFKNIIYFLLDLLPYEIVDKILPANIKTVNDAKLWIDAKEDNLKELIVERIDEIQDSRSKVMSILEAAINDISKDHIKQKYEDRINYIKDNNYKEIKYLLYFSYCVKETPIDNLKNTIIRYVDQLRSE